MIRTKLFFLWIGCCGVISTSVLSGCSTVNSDVYTQGAVQSAYHSSVRLGSSDTPSDLTLFIAPFVDLRTKKEDTGNLWKCAVPVLSMQARWDKPDWLNWDPMQYAGYKPFAQDLMEVFTGNLKKDGLFKDVQVDRSEQCDLILKGEIDELKLSLYPHFYGTSYFVGQFMGLLGIKMGEWDVQQTISFQIQDARTKNVVWRKRYKTEDHGALAMYYGRNPIAYGYPADQLIAPVLKTFRADLRDLLKKDEIRFLAQSPVRTIRPPLVSRTIATPVLQTDRGSRWAVAVGVSSYAQGSDLNNLEFADADAAAFVDQLKALGWSSSSIKLLTNKQATKRNVGIALESWLSKAGPNDLVVLYWAGHGFPDPEDPEKVYFACHDTDLRIPATGLRMDRVVQILKERNAQNVVVLADTCHAGKLLTRGGERGMAVVPGLNRMRREKNIPKGWIFMLGADTDRQSIEHTSWSNGAFTHCLLKALAGDADGFQSIGPKDGAVSMGELRAYMETVMPEETQRVLGAAKRPVIATSSGDPAIWELEL